MNPDNNNDLSLQLQDNPSDEVLARYQLKKNSQQNPYSPPYVPLNPVLKTEPSTDTLKVYHSAKCSKDLDYVTTPLLYKCNTCNTQSNTDLNGVYTCRNCDWYLCPACAFWLKSKPPTVETDVRKEPQIKIRAFDPIPPAMPLRVNPGSYANDIPVPQYPQCGKCNQDLVYQTYKQHFICYKCDRTVEKQGLYECSDCNWHLCLPCKAKHYPQREQAVPQRNPQCGKCDQDLVYQTYKQHFICYKCDQTVERQGLYECSDCNWHLCLPCKAKHYPHREQAVPQMMIVERVQTAPQMMYVEQVMPPVMSKITQTTMIVACCIVVFAVILIITVAVVATSL
jgi:hypothetical protein